MNRKKLKLKIVYLKHSQTRIMSNNQKNKKTKSKNLKSKLNLQ